MSDRTADTLDRARKLVQLLKDPHEGLITWNVAVAASLRQLGSMADADEQPDSGHIQRIRDALCRSRGHDFYTLITYPPIPPAPASVAVHTIEVAPTEFTRCRRCGMKAPEDA